MQKAPQGKWLALRPLTLFRLLLCVLFASLLTVPGSNEWLTIRDVFAYQVTLCTYSVVSLALLWLQTTGQPKLQTHLWLQIVADTLCLLSFMHLLGGVSSGVGMLVCASLACSALFDHARHAYAAAAFASIALLLSQQLVTPAPLLVLRPETHAALLSIAYFAVAAIGAGFIQRDTDSTQLIEQQRARLQQIRRWSGQILQDIDQGIAVLDSQGTLVFANPIADSVFADPTNRDALAIKSNTSFRTQDGRELLLDRQTLADEATLLTLRDRTALEAKLQKEKLATLGQLTAGVAHEVRNPLSAITQATDLLNELEGSPQLEKLTEIIQRNSLRIDRLVNDILSISRPTRSCKKLKMQNFLHQFKHNFSADLGNNPRVHIAIEAPADIQMTLDEDKLVQLLENLCRNAIKHNDKPDSKIKLALKNTLRGWQLSIVDNGPGIGADILPHIFEPFVSGRHNSAGLGLFLARQLASQLGALLEYQRIDQGSKFSLIFEQRTTIDTKA